MKIRSFSLSQSVLENIKDICAGAVLACAIAILSPYHAQAHPTKTPENHPKQDESNKNKQKSEWLILGSQSTSYALTRSLLKNGPATVLVRNREKVEKLFENKKNLTIIEGDATQSLATLEKAAAGKKYLYIGQTFPYKVWEKSLTSLIKNCIEVGKKTGIMLVYPGRVYKYGEIRSITETTQPKPNSHQGRVLKQIEDDLERAALKENCHVRIIRHSFPYGPGVYDGMISDNFTDMPKGKEFKWVDNTKIPFQFTYTPDLARAVTQYVKKNPKLPFDVLNFPGVTFETVDQFGAAVAEVMGATLHRSITYRPDTYSKFGLMTKAFFNKAAERGKDIFYSFEEPILLDGEKFEQLFPHFHDTPLNQAIRTTTLWYRKHPK